METVGAIEMYVRVLERRRAMENGEDFYAAALGELQQMGAIVCPVEDGEWTLRADRDEDGAFIAASFAETES